MSKKLSAKGRIRNMKSAAKQNKRRLSFKAKKKASR
tara:strand:- start:1525 stop:1632 length:108 start_codon:yes stop_codon:yes gene_type:complete